MKVFEAIKNIKEITMESLAHTKWNCKYHIVFIPKYRRKAIYGQNKKHFYLFKNIKEYSAHEYCDIYSP